MNRKLFNGLLLLTVATGGVGTFTSCKDTEQDFRNEVLVGQQDLFGQIDAIRNLNDATFRINLEGKIKELINAGDFLTAQDLIAIYSRIETIEERLTRIENKYADLEADYKAADAALKREILNELELLNDRLTTDIEQLRTTLTTLQNEIETKFSEIDGSISELTTSVRNAQTAADAAQSAADAAQSTADAAKAAANAAQSTADAAQSAADTAQSTADAAQSAADAAMSKATKAHELAEINAETIEKLKEELKKYENLPGAVEELQEWVRKVEEEFGELLSDLAQLRDDYNEFSVSIGNRLDDLKDEFDNFNDAVESMFNKILQAMAEFVTGLIINETYSPAFGNLMLPMDIKSNLLVNYYFEPNGQVYFPDIDRYGEYTGGKYNEAGLTLPTFKPSDVKVPMGLSLETLGDLYMTINPVGRNFTGLKFDLVKSNGEALPVQFEAESSNEVLTFGLTRAKGETSPNGFYKAAILPKGEDRALVEATHIDIDKTGLKDALKDVIKNHHAGDFIELAKLIYRQFDGVLPAYAAKVTWQSIDEKGEPAMRSVLSDYNMAVASFRPLSYSSAEGMGTNRELPTFGTLKSIAERVLNSLEKRIKLGLTGVTYEGIDIHLDFEITVSPTDITFDLSGTPVLKSGIKSPAGTEYYIRGNKIYYKDANGNEIAVPEADYGDIVIGYLPEGTKIVLGYNGTDVDNPDANALNPFVDQIIESISNALNGDPNDPESQSLEDKINSQVNEKMKQMIDDINTQLKNVQTKLDNTVGDIRDRVESLLNGRLGRAAQDLLDLYNRFATKVNDILKNPNAYLQVVMAYKDVNGGLQHFSTVDTDRTPVGKGIVDVYLTSYNADLIVPSCRKYVAIVETPAGITVEQANERAGEDFNKVLNGKQQEVAFNTNDLPAGNYKIFYQSLDYHGITSTREYYITVK